MRTITEIQRQENMSYVEAKRVQDGERLSASTCSTWDYPDHPLKGWQQAGQIVGDFPHQEVQKNGIWVRRIGICDFAIRYPERPELAEGKPYLLKGTHCLCYGWFETPELAAKHFDHLMENQSEIDKKDLERMKSNTKEHTPK